MFHLVDCTNAFRRHDCWGIVVMAGCSANLIFHMFSCISGGSTNDTIAWEMSELQVSGSLSYCLWLLVRHHVATKFVSYRDHPLRRLLPSGAALGVVW